MTPRNSANSGYPNIRHRRPIRLRGYDYSQSMDCFITICTHQREMLFGEIVEGRMNLNDIGRTVEEEWRKTPNLRPSVGLDVFVVMPNHFHGIIVISSVDHTGVSQYAPTDTNRPFRSPSQTIGAIVRGFKAAATKRVNQVRGTPGLPVWQRNYYEHIIRDEKDLDRVREYIIGNPGKWSEDDYHPGRWKMNA